ncbi:polyketide synthase [Streptomyces alanosinicus]|uniref:Polyketide synthase n=2 Tax=Streptomyces alanosinicus TaxID=68171 RepID=A0A918YK29_9ACTN|nr:polyketide synthase [Streptomyces alanosinicus]
MSGRFPGAQSIDELWRALREGRELISFFDRRELLDLGVPAADVDDLGYVAARGALDAPLAFDASFFGYSAREAELMDPQQRLILETAWHVAEDAGCRLADIDGRVGVFAAAAPPTYLSVFQQPKEAGGLEIQLGNDTDFAASRVSYKLDLNGPSVSVATACSSGLAVVHLACQSLLSGDSDVALAVAASVRFPADRGLLRGADSILSPDGHCRAFGADADGTVEADGAVGVLLKRLEDAVDDRDHIYAVIRGSAMGNDGAHRVGFTAPGARGQQSVLAEALRFADVRPEDVGYVEAHGTGTPLGDPIEMRAMAGVYGTAERTEPCRVGSLKSNLGHLNHASGMAGLVKAVLCLRHREFVPTLHTDRVNPELDLADGRLRIQREREPWPEAAVPRTAAVSSFGMGGTNVHMIVSEAPAVPASASGSRPAQAVILPLSARSGPALEEARARLAAWLRAHGDTASLADVAHTLQTGRTAFPHRAAVVCRTKDEAIAALDRPAEPVLRPGSMNRDRVVAFLFPGQGAQRPGMARALYRSAPVFRAVLDECLEYARREPGLESLRALLLDEDVPMDAELRRTALAQPALFAVEYAMARQWMAHGVLPGAMLGHSVGEFVAACVAGVFSAEDAMRLVARRGRLVQSVEPGGMSAVRLPEEEVSAALGELRGWEFSAYNAVDQCVISAPFGVLESAEEALRAHGAVTTRLKVSHAFHSRSVEPVLEQFAREVERTARHQPRYAYLTNVTGNWITPEEATSVDHWVRHLREPVRFGPALSTVKEALDPVFLHLGPGTSVGDLARGAGADQVVFGLGRGEREDTRQASLAALWTAGARIDWPSLAGPDSRRVSLPGYPFQRQVFALPLRGSAPAAPPAADSERLPVHRWFYAETWAPSVELPLPSDRLAGQLPERWAVVGGGQVADALAELGRSWGKRVTALGSVAGPDGEALASAEPELVLTVVENDGADGESRLHGADGATRAPGPELSGVRDVMTIVRLLAEGEQRSAARVLALAVSDEAQGESAAGPPGPPNGAALVAAARVLDQENPGVTVSALPVARYGAPASQVAVRALRRLVDGRDDDAVLVGERRLRRLIEPLELPADALPPTRLKRRGVYVITGGLGRIGLRMASYLARHHEARLVLVGRRTVPLRSEWPSVLADPSHPCHGLVGEFTRWEKEGAHVTPVSADVTSMDSLARAWDEAESAYGRVDGVVHAAGLSDADAFPLARDTDGELAARHRKVKSEGALHLAALAADRRPDFVLALSSLSTVLGGLGFSAYAAASAAMESVCASASGDLPVEWCAVRLDGWEDKEGGGAVFRRRVADVIRDDDADELFDVLFRLLPLGVVMVSTTDLPARLAGRKVAMAADEDERQGKEDQAPAESFRYPRPALSTPYREPGDEFEGFLVGVFSELLRTEGIGVDDDFFELGGHSLLAMSMVDRLRTELGLDIGLRVLFEAPTAAQLAQSVEALLRESETA